jgi:hypothetical protein
MVTNSRTLRSSDGDPMACIKPIGPQIVAPAFALALAVTSVVWAGWMRGSFLVIATVIALWAVVSVIRSARRIASGRDGAQVVNQRDSGKGFRLPDEPKPVIDRQVRFTVYRPDRVQPEVWNSMLAFAYRGGDDEEGGGDLKVSFKEVEDKAAAVLGPEIQGFASLTTDSRHAIPRGDVLRFVPRVDGLEFNPPERSFQWVERVHREDFRFRAPNELDGRIVHGRMEVYFGIIAIAEIGLTISVDRSAAVIETGPKAAAHGRPYRKIFASYSHKDLPVVAQFKVFADAFGDEFMRDWTHLKAGEVWSERLQSMISEADVFQLFWSTNSMASDFVRQEWEYALGLNRPSFVRPVYWEEPMPERSEKGLPPDALRRLQFYRFTLNRQPETAAEERRAARGGDRRGVSQRNHEVFISYAPKDKNWADAACAELERHRIRCWVAPRDITPGIEWAAAVISGLDASKVMVLIFSTHANQSAQVGREVVRAIGKGLIVLAFRVEDVIPAGAMEFALSQTHWLDGFTPPVERRLDLLASSVKSLLGDQYDRHAGVPASAIEPTTRSLTSFSPAHRRSLFAAGFAVLTMIIIVVVLLALLGRW